MSIKTKGVIVDADVARSAGVTEHPVSKSSRDTLMALKDSPNFHLVFCPKLREEWKAHKSRFSSAWLTSMYAKKKVKLTAPPSIIEPYIHIHAGSEKNINIALKDKHLVDSALNGDSVIISNDAAARAVFALVSKEFSPLGCVFWVAPNISSFKLLFFISNNKNPEDDWKLNIA